MKDLCNEIREVIDGFPEFDNHWDLLDYFRTTNFKCKLNKINVETIGDSDVYCGKNVTIQPYVLFSGQVFIGDNVTIGPFSFLRGPIFIGSNCLIGPHAEIIRTIISKNSTLAHKNLLGDSIICENSTLAGLCTICNVSLIKDGFKVWNKNSFEKKIGKYGAYIGKNVKMGALTIMMPGTYVENNTEVIGQSILYGNTKIKSMVTLKGEFNND